MTDTHTEPELEPPTLGVGYIDDVGVTACIDLQDWDDGSGGNTAVNLGLVNDSRVDGNVMVHVTQRTGEHWRQAVAYVPFALLEQAIRELREHEDVIR